MYAAFGSDGKHDIVWGIGETRQAAINDAQRWVEPLGGDIDTDSIDVEEITPEQALIVEAGCREWPIVGRKLATLRREAAECPKAFVAIGSDGIRDVVWGLGDTREAALDDAQRWIEASDAELDPDTIEVEEIAAEGADRIEAGDISWPIVRR